MTGAIAGGFVPTQFAAELDTVFIMLKDKTGTQLCTYAASFPPISRWQGCSRAAAAAATCLPPSLDPVKKTELTWRKLCMWGGVRREGMCIKIPHDHVLRRTQAAAC
jgi:hypothetical protein